MNPINNRVDYKKYTFTANDENTCGICMEDLKDTLAESTIYHKDPKKEEWLHAGHEKCLKAWLETHPNCPTCRIDVNTNSVFSWRERTITKICATTNNIIKGALFLRDEISEEVRNKFLAVGLSYYPHVSAAWIGIILSKVDEPNRTNKLAKGALQILGYSLALSLSLEDTPYSLCTKAIKQGGELLVVGGVAAMLLREIAISERGKDIISGALLINSLCVTMGSVFFGHFKPILMGIGIGVASGLVQGVRKLIWPNSNFF